jgi:hypothetical protein
MGAMNFERKKETECDVTNVTAPVSQSCCMQLHVSLRLDNVHRCISMKILECDQAHNDVVIGNCTCTVNAILL